MAAEVLPIESVSFVMVPTWLLGHRGVSDGAKVLYGVLHGLVVGREGPTRPVTRARLAAGCGVSVDTVDRRLGELAGVGAVAKEARFETEHGQVANVYWVRLSPPVALVHSSTSAGSVRAVRQGRAAVVRSPGPQGCGNPGRVVAAPSEEVKQELDLPPQPPRTAGGPTRSTSSLPPGRRRGEGSSLRAIGANPRAEAGRVLFAEQAAAAAQRAADLEAANTTRRAVDDAAQAEADRFDAEALALSAVLDDTLLARVVELSTTGLAGPLARSPMAVTRAVVGWCRAAAPMFPGPVPDALAAAASVGWRPASEEPGVRLELAAAPPGTAELRARIARIVRPEALPLAS